MGVILSLLLLGGFAQDNLTALSASQGMPGEMKQDETSAGRVSVILLANPYQGFEPILEPQASLKKGIFKFSLGYLVSTSGQGTVKGIPVTADAGLGFQLIDNLYANAHLGMIGPATFFAGDPYASYETWFSASAGAQATYAPFASSALRPLFSLGGSAGYMLGELVSGVSAYREPLQGFGGGGRARLGAVYSRDNWSVSLEAGTSYTGVLVPEVSLSLLW